tara:strand:- start:2877 stop:4151 length:1275 start_codon:yes stop_codon:yes gene_type:complete
MAKSKQGCHTGNPLVFEAQGIKVYAGGTSRQGTWVKMNPYPDVAIGPTDVMRLKTTTNVLPEGWSCAEKVVTEKMPHIIGIEWPDYGVPSNLGREFWLALIDDFKKNDVKSVSTSCMGGHGRTGVQLCILAHLLIPEKDRTWSDVAQLINYIRETYCDHAVEGINQQEYIADIIDLPVGDSLFIQTKASIAWGVDESMGNIWDEIDSNNKKNKPKTNKGKTWTRKAIQGAPYKKNKGQKNKGQKNKGQKNKGTNISRYLNAKALQRGYTLIERIETDYKTPEDKFMWIPNALLKGDGEKVIEELFGIYNTIDNLDEDKDGWCITCNKEYHLMEMYHNECKYCMASAGDFAVDYENKKIENNRGVSAHATFMEVIIDTTDGYVNMVKLSDTPYFKELAIQLEMYCEDTKKDKYGMKIRETKRGSE